MACINVEYIPRDGKIIQAGSHSSILQSGTNPLELVGAHRKALDAVDTSRIFMAKAHHHNTIKQFEG